MQEPKHNESRLDFQIERLSFFSDGVFAIAITLLVIEIKVPVLDHATNEDLLHSLSHMFLKFLGFIISFAIVGHYWSVHHRMFGYIKKYNTSLLWINLAFLFSVVLLPFSSGFIGEYSSDMELWVPYAVYVGNICLTALMNCWLWLYISNQKKQFLTHTISKTRVNLGLYRSLIIPAVFLLSLIVFFINPVVSRFIPLIIPIILHWGLRGYERKANLRELIIDPAELSIENNKEIITSASEDAFTPKNEIS
jgi:uncharacterized membrane protein